MSESSRQPKKRKKSRVLRAVKRLIKWLVIAAVAAAAVLFGLKAYIAGQAGSGGDAAAYSRAVVARGAMEETVYGTGTTSARNQPNVFAGVDGTLTQLRMSVGDEVKAGDILAVITNDTLDSSITDYEFALWELDDEIAGTKAGSKVYAVESPVAGRVMALYAGVGDDALAVFRREGALALISTDGRMKVEIIGDSALNVRLGDKVTVTGDTVAAEGTVSDLIRQGTQATVTIIGDEYPMGEIVTVKNAAGEVIGTGEMQINKPMAVSSYGGTIDRIPVKVGDTVKRQTVLYWLEDSPLTLTVESLRLQRETAANDLATAKEQRENLIVIAPCDGVIATIDAAEGDAITSGQLLCSILQGEEMNLTIAVDELDVVKVAQGQSVNITVDAFGEAVFTGEVAKIAPVGTNSGGVTTYDVELAFEAAGTGVRSGMNATGEICVASVEDTLYVPVEALMTIGNQTYVMLDDGGAPSSAAGAQGGGRSSGAQAGRQRGAQGTEQAEEGAVADRRADASAGAQEESFLSKAVSGVKGWLYEGVPETAAQVSGTLAPVTVGLQNDEYAEILSGVSEGDVLLYTGGEDTVSAYGGRSSNRGGMNMSGMGGMMRGF